MTADQILAIMQAHAPSYWWSPANVAFGTDTPLVARLLASLHEQGLVRSTGGDTPLYAVGRW